MATSKNIHPTQNHLTCARCSGLLIREGLFDLFDDTGQMRRWAWRCVQCGDIVDSLILKHRVGENLPDLTMLHRRRWTGVQTATRRPLS